ncbi:MAG: molybdenum ABC transporter ATP-binding protein [Ketobacter sp.]
MSIELDFRMKYASSAERGFNLDVKLTLPAQGITAIFGPSGSGKTTLLRCIAGLIPVPHAKLIVNGMHWQDGSSTMPTHKRPLGYVFQESSLFPHLTAKKNLEYARKRADDSSSMVLYHRVVALMDLEPVLQQYPAQLSGGERQRVAIARALLINPKLLLMDEPLASLDPARKREIMPYLERLHTEFHLPILYVSHSIDEVTKLADHLVLLERGRVVTHGPVTEVVAQSEFTLHSGVDTGIIVEARVVERDSRWHLTRVAFSGGTLWVRDAGDEEDQVVRIRILARDISLALDNHSDSSILNRLQGRITQIIEDKDPAMALVWMQVGSVTLIARITQRSAHHLELQKGVKVWAQIKSVAVVR